ncbi:MAG: phytoene desaturase [Chitinophagaceae bacterium]|nr:phytoene desaturase [Chitinophagaceae bacterium]MCB9045149.1 phytoene desaturase [Chitinophagales bacterium]
MDNVTVIGGGFSGLAAACYVAKAGAKVSLYEKNATIGGRARHYTDEGFMFDMGPSWYWMPDVFERFFADFGKQVSDYYELVQLDPGFQVFFKEGEPLTVPANKEELYNVFEEIEPGCSARLTAFLNDADYKYKVGMTDLVYKPGLSVTEYINYDVLKGIMGAHLFKSVSSHVRTYFKDPRLMQLMEFPILFLGAMAKDIPALYTLMNHAALTQGTWYPMGGMSKIVMAMEDLARSLGVEIHTSSPVNEINVIDGKVRGITTSDGFRKTDAVIASGDYHYVEQHMLEEQYRNYDEKYWDKKTFAPSCLIYYVGVNKKVKKLQHHNLFFDADFEQHSKDIYKNPDWPQDPLFYVCCPSKTDDSVAPEGQENLFILIPIAPGIEDTPEMREKYFPEVVKRIEKHCSDNIAEHVVYKKSYCLKDFMQDYHAYKGNAYGLANTLRQTAILKPSLRNKKVPNLLYTGQLTVPGPGVPPALISGKLAATEALKTLKKKPYEAVVR